MINKIEAAAISNCKSPQMLPPFPEVIAPTFIGFALGGVGYVFVRLLIAKNENKECERRMGFWRPADMNPIEICVV
jgi:hypothetical protein